MANDVPLKHIQEWLGHSDIGTTANIYSHLDYKSKITSANVMDNILALPDTKQTGWHTWILAENHVRRCDLERKEKPSHMGKSLDMTGFLAES